MKILKVAGFLTAALCAAVFLFVAVTMPPRAVRLGSAPADMPVRPVAAGAYHVHTVRSDGTGTVEEVAAAAARAGLRFVIFTDHGDGTRVPDPPQYRSGVLCLDGVEISTAQGHYAAIGMHASPYPLAGEARDVMEDVARLGGFGVAAHPDSPKEALRWREWGAPVDAIEWLNADSEWRGQPRLRLGRLFLQYALRGPESLAAMFGRPAPTLARWDALTRQRRVVALAGADAHARLGWQGSGDPYAEGASLHLPSYEAVFRSFAMRLQIDRALTGRAPDDAVIVRRALAGGHLYTAIDGLAGPATFDLLAQSGPYTAGIGDTLTLAGPVTIDARVNAPTATVVLLEDGRRVASGTGRVRYVAPQRPAVFRAEVQLPSQPDGAIPWILSNPIYAGGPIDARRPIVRAEVVRTENVTAGPSSWTIERQPRSLGSVMVAGPATLVFDYALAAGPRADQYAAMVHEVSRLEAFDRLQFRARASRPMRLSVQFRAPNARGGARWQRSIYLDGQPRDVTIFLDDLRPIGPTSTWQPDLARVSSLLMVVDIVNTPPGIAGQVTFEDVRLAAGR